MSGQFSVETPTYTACMSCGADWFAAFPPGVRQVTCPKCGAKDGEPVQIHNWAWFVRFTFVDRDQWKKRAAVCINAKEMEGQL